MKISATIFLAAFLVGAFFSAPSYAFPAPASGVVAVEFSVEGLSFGDWIQTIEDKIDEAITAAKEIGAIVTDKLEEIGQEALEKLVSATGNLEEALDRFVQEILPKLISKAKSLAESGSASLEAVADAVVSMLKTLGAKALESAVKWIQENQDQVGKMLSELILSKIKEIIVGRFHVAAFTMTSRAIEYLKEKLLVLMKLAYDEAIVLVDNIIYYLKTFGVPALKAALEYIKEMQCELGEMVYRMLHNKLNAALGIEDVETFLNTMPMKAIGMESPMDINSFSAMEVLAFKDWLEAVGDKIKEIIESGKEIGKDAAAAIKNLGQEALDKLIEASANIQAAKQKFVEQVLPKILEKTKDLAEKGEAAANIVINAIVGILKKLGSTGLQFAIDWLETNKEQIGQKIYDKIIAKIEEALAEVGLNPFDALEVLSFKDWLESIGDKIVDIIEAGKEIGKEAGEAIKDLGQEALDKLIEASANIQAAKQKFVEQVLPKIMEKTKDLAEKGEAAANIAINAIVGILKKLGSTGLQFATDWLEANKEQIGQKIYDKIVAKIEEALRDIGLETASSYGAMEKAEEYVKESIMKAAYAGYDAAVYLFDKMIEFLKVFGIGALRLAERLVEANKCLVGAYIFGMAMTKVKAAIKVAAIGGIVG